MNITTLQSRGAAGLSDLADLVIPDLPPYSHTRVRIMTGQTVLLDNYYFGNFANEIHLDLRDLVLNNTYMTVPGLFREGSDTVETTTMENSVRMEEQAILPLSFQIYAAGNGAIIYSFIAYPFDFFPKYAWNRFVYTPPIDELLVPEDYLIPLTTFLTTKEAVLTRTFWIFVEKASGNINWQVEYTGGILQPVLTTHLASLREIIDGGYFRPEYGEPFRIGIYYSAGTTKQVWTPYFKMTRKKMEQYAFLSQDGIYYNIPMSGKLYNRPEYDIEVLKRSDSFETTSATMSDLHEQNSGALTKKTATVLASLLVSRSVYHYDTETCIWRRITIENPAVNLASSGGAYSLTFQWHYADNNEYNQ